MAVQSKNMLDKGLMSKPFELIVGPKSGGFFSHYPNSQLGERLLYADEFKLVIEGMSLSTKEYNNLFQNRVPQDKFQK